MKVRAAHAAPTKNLTNPSDAPFKSSGKESGDRGTPGTLSVLGQPFYCVQDIDYGQKKYIRNPPLHAGAARQYPNVGAIEALGIGRTTDQPGLGVIGGHQTLYHGWVENDPKDGSPEKFRCHFLYNPAEVGTSFGFDPGVSAQSNNAPAANRGGFYSTSSSMNLTLFFDRTFESYLSPLDNNNAWLTLGVRNDTLLLEKLCGLSVVSGFSGTSAEGVLGGKQVRVNFDRYGRFVFSGYINGLNTNFTHFTRDMVPTRAIVNLSVQQTLSEIVAQGSTDARQQATDAAGLGSDVTLPGAPAAATGSVYYKVRFDIQQGSFVPKFVAAEFTAAIDGFSNFIRYVPKRSTADLVEWVLPITPPYNPAIHGST